MDTPSPFSDSTAYTKSSRRPRVIIYVVLFLIVLGLLLFIGSRFLGTSNTKQTVTPTPTIAVSPTETPTPTPEISPTGKAGTVTPTTKVSPTPVKGVTPTKTASGTIDKATGLDRAALTVQVLNGSGVPGVAAKMQTTLEDLGYIVVSTGNADTFDYTGVTIQVKSTKNKYLSLLQKDLASTYTVSDTSADLTSGTADAVVIVGK